MGDVIQNPRRVPRAPARCEARCLLPGGGYWATDTADVGPKGCGLTAPGPFKSGDPVDVTLTNERVGRPLQASGRVAWASSRPPWRIGVAFSEPHLAEAERWFEELLTAYPGLGSFQHAPDSIPADATVRLGPPPRVAPELSEDEVALLRAVAGGVTVRVLREVSDHPWPAIEGLLFALLGKRYLTLDAARAGTPEQWAPLLPRR